MKKIYTYESPLGTIVISTDDGTITGADFGKLNKSYAENTSPLPSSLKKQLDDYFAGKRVRFSFRYSMDSSPFRKKVYEAMKKIPYGKTISYRDLATQAGSPRAVRAAASACAHNPIVLFIPCHRVIGSDGSLHGYSAGLWRKKWLLDKEAGKKQ